MANKKHPLARWRAVRSDSGWSQQRLADEVGVSLSTIARIESEWYLPKLETALKIAAAFQIPVEWIWGDPEHVERELKFVERAEGDNLDDVIMAWTELRDEVASNTREFKDSITEIEARIKAARSASSSTPSR